MPVIDYYEETKKVKRVDSEKTLGEVYENARHTMINNGFQPVEHWSENTEREAIETVPFSFFDSTSLPFIS